MARENAKLLQPIIAGFPALRAEVVYAVRYEMAATIEDVLARRIGMQLHSWRDAMDAAPVVGSLMAAELHWDETSASEAVHRYVEKINRLQDSAGLSSKAPVSKAGASGKSSTTGSVAH